MHDIDIAEVVSSGSGESIPDKCKKKLPNLVKISDLRRGDSLDDDQSPELHPEDPPTIVPSFMCPHCPAVFLNKPDLMMHLQLQHTEHAAHLCGLCLHQCTSYMNLKTHLQTCSQQLRIANRYICQVCQYGDDNFKSLENHVLVHDFLLEACRKQARMFDPADYIDTNDKYENGVQSPASKTLRCSECGLNHFKSFKDFNTHRRNQHSIYHCDLCNKFYGRNSHLWKHVNRLHKGHPSITCQLCYKTSASKYHLAQHFNKIHSTKAVQKSKRNNKEDLEDFMTKKFSPFDFQSVRQSFLLQELIENNGTSGPDDDSEGIEYMKQEIKEEILEAPKEIDPSHNLYTTIITNYSPPLNSGEFKCPKCSKAFQKRLLLKKHKKNCRPKMQKDLLTRCKTCSRIFKDRLSLTKHLVNYHSEYICEICSEKVQSKCEIVAHIRFQHPGCSLFCKVCKNVLRSQSDLEEHLRTHMDSYICQFCGDPLPSKIKLKMHILSLHRKILSLSCGICLKLFENQHVLRDHVALVHKDQLTPLTSCPVCGKNYGSKWKTYDHLNKSHGRIFRACKTCLELFDNDAQLQAHCDVNSHSQSGGVGGNQHSIMAHITSAINEVATNMEVHDDEESDSEDGEENSEQSNEETENEQTEKPTVRLSQESKLSLLEERLTGRRAPEGESMINQQNDKKILPEGVKKSMVSRKETKSPVVNSSKRTVYVNSNDPSCCEICYKTWPAKKHLWQHYIRCHKSIAATVCGICLKANDSYEELQKHLRENHPTLLYGQGFGSNFICRICGRYHNASSKLRLHMVIHENFDWAMLNINMEEQGEMEEKPTKNDVNEEFPNKAFDDNNINYDSLIEQVECSSQSENEFSENDESHFLVLKEEDESSDDEEYVPSRSSIQDEMLKNVISEERRGSSQRGYHSSEESSSSISVLKTECSDIEYSQDSQAFSLQTVQSNVNSSSLVLNSNIFRREPEELDSAIKSISYECMEPVDLNIVDNYYDLQNNCLNENEIESAVGSIL